MAKPLVFLDFDGVLNSWGYIQKINENGRDPEAWEELDPVNITRLNRLLRETGAEVVIASTWRKAFPLEEILVYLKRAGFEGLVIGVTPTLAVQSFRGDEIAAWIDENEAWDRQFVILDDDSDMADLVDHHVKTKMIAGLTDDDVDEAVAIIGHVERG